MWFSTRLIFPSWNSFHLSGFPVLFSIIFLSLRLCFFSLFKSFISPSNSLFRSSFHLSQLSLYAVFPPLPSSLLRPMFCILSFPSLLNVITPSGVVSSAASFTPSRFPWPFFCDIFSFAIFFPLSFSHFFLFFVFLFLFSCQ